MLDLSGKYMKSPRDLLEREHVAWDELIASFGPTKQQVLALEQYLRLLIEWNEKFNLTTITQPTSIIRMHFYDSLAIKDCVNFQDVKAIADVGSGAGFPGLPLKILFPHLTVVLIEVNHKKRQFLQYVADRLGLDNVVIYPNDWRTFLRKTDYRLDYFFARASLQPEELVRLFKQSCPYNGARLVYWASNQWSSDKNVVPFFEKECGYEVGGKKRKFVFFARKD